MRYLQYVCIINGYKISMLVIAAAFLTWLTGKLTGNGSFFSTLQMVCMLSCHDVYPLTLLRAWTQVSNLQDMHAILLNESAS